MALSTDLGRSTRIYASGYNRNRVHESNLVVGEKRPYVADFNGLLPAGVTLEEAVWETWNNYAIVMSNAELFTRATQVVITAQYSGNTWIRCTAISSAGEKYVQRGDIYVGGLYWYENPPPVTGPARIVVTTLMSEL